MTLNINYRIMKISQTKNIAITVTDSKLNTQGIALAKNLGLPFVEIIRDQYLFLLRLNTKQLELVSLKEKIKPIYVDFTKGKLQHRRLYGGGKQQLIARAVGLRNNKNLTVLDLTAGLGEDAFVLANLGCQVTMIERSKIIAALLEDGLRRASQAAWFSKLELKLLHTESKRYLERLPEAHRPDVIYLDPMFPSRNNSALVKKEMRVLRELVGEDEDASSLLVIARSVAKKRVVIKRPRLAPPLENTPADIVYSGKSSRFDVYTQYR